MIPDFTEICVLTQDDVLPLLLSAMSDWIVSSNNMMTGSDCFCCGTHPIGKHISFLKQICEFHNLQFCICGDKQESLMVRRQNIIYDDFVINKAMVTSNQFSHKSHQNQAVKQYSVVIAILLNYRFLEIMTVIHHLSKVN